jgi:hypothetical protein
MMGTYGLQELIPDSDIAVLVEFEPGHVPRLALIRMQAELSALLGHEIDLVTPKFLNRRRRRGSFCQTCCCQFSLIFDGGWDIIATEEKRDATDGTTVPNNFVVSAWGKHIPAKS